ncbi:copper-binding protein [Massilia sp. GCM10020059]|uniref:Copper-binding protein n=1 Tax=Massilia agrisoli TaxID=2892444 RepID=A0ABS8IU97_9BURK|nr:copper-binding protein [Massilia agrisoli]MCC6070840.1 copper-binding protein [Massilia agrisoli]
MKFSTLVFAAAVALPFAGAAMAQPAPAAAAAAAPVALVAGEVKKINKETGKMTIKHGPLVSLDMPAMTMVFRVKDPAMLDQVKVGDKINFAVERANGAMTVTQLEAAK